MKQENQVKIFGIIVFYLFVLNLLYNNGIIERSPDPYWIEWVSQITSFNDASSQIINLHHLLFLNFSDSSNLFTIRVPGVLVLLLSCWGMFHFGKKIFGKQTITITLLTLISSFLIPLSGKFATADIWLFAAQTLSTIFLILYLKQPIFKWHIWHALAVLSGILIEPVSTIVFTLLLCVFFYFLHPNGKVLKNCWGFLLTIPIALGLYFGGIFSYNFNSLPILNINYQSTSILNYFTAIIIGILPWFVFFPAALKNMIIRFRKREELAIITCGWLLASIFSFSLATQAILALLIAKQVIGYFDKNYPYENWVKTTSILHLGFALFAAIYWMIIWWEKYTGDGFRPAMWTSFLYWSGCLVAFLGLYGKNQKSIIVGLTMAGLLTSYLFWSQVFPLWGS